jgi:hypothetical protein
MHGWPMWLSGRTTFEGHEIETVACRFKKSLRWRMELQGHGFKTLWIKNNKCVQNKTHEYFQLFLQNLNIE